MNRAKRGACPGHDAFVRAFMKECTPAETERLVTHVMSCPPCWEKFQVMRRVKIDAAAPLDQTPGTRSPSYRLTFRMAAVLGTALILLLGGLFLLKMEKPAAIRGSEPGGLALLEPAGVLHVAPAVLRCTPVAGADYYVFKVIAEDLETIVATGSDKPRLELDEGTRAKLVTGKTYLCTVTVTDDASRIIESVSRSFEIK